MSINFIRGNKPAPAVLVAMQLPVQWCSFSGLIRIERLCLKWHNEFQRFTCWREGPHTAHNLTLWQCNFSFVFSHRFQFLSFCSWETLMMKTLLRNWKLSLAHISSLINYDLITPSFFRFSPKLVLAFFHQQHPWGACEILSCSGELHVGQVQLAVLSIALSGPCVVQPRCIKHTDRTMHGECFVVGSCSWRQKILTE